MYFYIISLSAFASSNGSLESPTIAPRGSTRCLSNLFPFGLPTRAFNFRGRNVITFYSFRSGETQSEDKGEERARERERRKGTIERKEDEVETSYEG